MSRRLGAGAITLVVVCALGCNADPGGVLPDVSYAHTGLTAASYDIQPLDVPASMGDFTSAFGNNNSGMIVGNYAAPDGSAHGFIYRQGTFTDFTVPGAGPADRGTLLDINDRGTAIGVATDASDATFMFLRAPDGTVEVLPEPAPGALFAEGQGINNTGTVVGFYIDGGGGRHGFIWRSGTYETYDYPGAARTVLTGINDRGEIAGYWRGSNPQLHGFVLRNGRVRPIEYPGAVSTRPGGINNFGAVTGYYVDTGGATHGFLSLSEAYSSLDFPGGSNTASFGIDEQGVLAGTYDDFSRGFVAFPKSK